MTSKILENVNWIKAGELFRQTHELRDGTGQLLAVFILTKNSLNRQADGNYEWELTDYYIPAEISAALSPLDVLKINTMIRDESERLIKTYNGE